MGGSKQDQFSLDSHVESLHTEVQHLKNTLREELEKSTYLARECERFYGLLQSDRASYSAIMAKDQELVQENEFLKKRLGELGQELALETQKNSEVDNPTTVVKRLRCQLERLIDENTRLHLETHRLRLVQSERDFFKQVADEFGSVKVEMKKEIQELTQQLQLQSTLRHEFKTFVKDNLDVFDFEQFKVENSMHIPLEPISSTEKDAKPLTKLDISAVRSKPSFCESVSKQPSLNFLLATRSTTQRAKQCAEELGARSTTYRAKQYAEERRFKERSRTRSQTAAVVES